MSIEKLKKFVEPKSVEPMAKKVKGKRKRFDLEKWIEAYNIPITGKTKNVDGTQYIYVICPWDSTHKDAAIIVSDGRLAFKCFHDSCSGRDWKEFRQIYEPNAYEQQMVGNDFFEDGKFIPARVAEWLLTSYTFAFDRSSLFVYENGVYRECNTFFVKQKCQELLLDDYCDRHGNEVMAQITTKLWRNDQVLDLDHTKLNCQNGMVDIDSLKLLPHSPVSMSSIQIPVCFDPGAQCPAIEAFLKTVLPEDCIESVIEFIGDCMTTEAKYQKAFLLTSAGESGKSVFLNLLTAFLGAKNVSNVSLQDIAGSRFRAAAIPGKLANICADLPNTPLEDSGDFKKMVTGDVMQFEKKNQDPYNYKPFTKFIFSCNELPRTKDATHGFFRRLQIIPFPNSFPEGDKRRNPNIIHELTTPEELSGLLNLALAGLARLRKRGHYTLPDSSKAELNLYRSANDSARLFLEEYAVELLDSTISKADLYGDYKNFCQDTGLRAQSAQKFNQRLQSMFVCVIEVRDKGIRMWKGLYSGYRIGC